MQTLSSNIGVSHPHHKGLIPPCAVSHVSCSPRSCCSCSRGCPHQAAKGHRSPVCSYSANPNQGHPFSGFHRAPRDHLPHLKCLFTIFPNCMLVALFYPHNMTFLSLQLHPQFQRGLTDTKKRWENRVGTKHQAQDPGDHLLHPQSLLVLTDCTWLLPTATKALPEGLPLSDIPFHSRAIFRAQQTQFPSHIFSS